MYDDTEELKEIEELIINFNIILKNKKKTEYSIIEYEYYFKEFYNDYKNKIYKDRKNIKEIIGGYGELLFYRKLLKNTELEIVWVSREHGDKYGFDFVTFNEVLNEYTFYEIKTTVNPKKIGEFYLTRNEYENYNKINKYSQISDKVKFIIANILIDDKQIIKEVDYYLNPNEIELIEYGKTVITQENNKKLSHTENILTKRLKL